MNRSLASALLFAFVFLICGFSHPMTAQAKQEPMTTVSNIQTKPQSVKSLERFNLTAIPPSTGTLPDPVIIVSAPIKKAPSAGVKVIEDILVKELRQKAKVTPKPTSKKVVYKKVKSPVRKTTAKKVYKTSSKSGTTASKNWATPGQCTWGALKKWYSATGYYLGGFHGNAYTWNERARAAGHSVGYSPRTRSIVVFEPGVAGASSVGHVAWVIGVSGNKVTFVEMNGSSGPFNWDTRTVTNREGMSYIYAP